MHSRELALAAVEEMQLSFMRPDQVLLGDSSSSQRSLCEEEELKLSVHMKSFKNHKSQENHNAHVI
ncbi:hypothetical protein EK904_003986 [Melospiza melodia maxima]|nr:hypothetical protein EK904_003986 [Melospiza melodia maxima]